MNKLDLNSFGLSELSAEEAQVIDGGSVVAAVLFAVLFIGGIILALCSDNVNFCDPSDVPSAFDNPLPQYA